MQVPWGSRLVDARLLAWLFVVVFFSGLALLAVAPWWLVGVHAASTLLLAGGALGHLIVRRGRPASPARALASGGWTLAVVGVAAATGLGVELSDRIGVVHVAVSVLAVVAAGMAHLKRKGRARAAGRPEMVLLAVGASLVLAPVAGPVVRGIGLLWWLVVLAGMVVATSKRGAPTQD